MKGECEFLAFAAGALHFSGERLTLETAFGDVPEWDSIGQLRLAAEVGKRCGREIPLESLVRMTTLWDFFRHAEGVPMRKAVAVDLDGTLWEGIVSEDGPAGIRPRVGFQRELLGLRRRGTLLVALSKNDAAAVEPVWRDPRMALGRGDFVALSLDWGEKADALARVAAQLGLGTDAFVFVDDNPVERERMRRLRPEVAVAAFPPRLAAYFPTDAAVTAEDRFRTARYLAEARRRAEAAKVGAEEYLAGLRQWFDIHLLKADEVARVAQLAARANRFVLAPDRPDVGEVTSWLDDADSLSLVLHAGDRFGELGLVAFAHARLVGELAELADFTMSCRAADRGLEVRLMAELARRLAARGAKTMVAAHRSNGRNAPFADLLPRCGFVRGRLDLAGGLPPLPPRETLPTSKAVREAKAAGKTGG